MIAPIVPLSGGGFGPDPYFYCLVAITWPTTYSFTFNDYGGEWFADDHGRLGGSLLE